MTLSLLIPQEALDQVMKRLGKIARTAGVQMEILPGTTTLIDDKRVLVCSRLSIGAMPSVSGYEFAARIEHTKDGNVIVRGPGETHDFDLHWRAAPPNCDHCKTRRSRKETFLVRQHGIGLLQIARNCLADFLMVSPTQIVAIAEFVKALGGELDDERWGSYGGSWEVAPLAYVACAVSSIERHGFRKSDSDGPTRASADFISGRMPSGDQNRERWLEEQPTEAQIEKAKLIAAWLLSLQESDLASEYLWNLHLAMKQPGCGKHRGLLASAPVAYDRAQGNAVKKKLEVQKRAVAATGFAVEEGFIFQGEVELIRQIIVPGAFGSKAICIFRSDSGHEIKWAASGDAPREIGQRYTIKGRCKKHETYKGVSQTVLSRVSWKGFQGMQNHEGNRPEEKSA